MPSPVHLGIVLLLAIGGYLYWRRYYRAAPLPTRVVAITIVLMAVLALLGGRVAYALAHGLDSAGIGNFLSSLGQFEGWRAGYASLGVIAGGGVALVLAALIARFPFFRLADTFAPALFIACAIWRVGCMFHGCCYGVPTSLPWGVVFNVPSAVLSHSQPVHPTQLYEAAFCLLAFLLLPLLLARLQAHNGQGLSTALCLMVYGAGRFAIDFLRAPMTTQYAAGLTLTQWAGLCVLVAGCVLLPYLLKRRRTSARVSAS